MPPRRKNKFYPAPSSRATRSHTATTASREAASPSAGTQPALSDIAGEDRGVQLDALVESEGDTDGSERANHHAGTAAGGLYNSDGHRLTIVLPGNGSTLESNENESVLVPVPSSTRNRKSVRIAVPESEAKVEDEDEPEAKPISLKRKRGRPSTKPVVPEAVEDVIDDSDLVVPPKLPCFVQVGDARRRLELDWAADLQDVKYRVSDLTKVLPWDLELAYSNDTMKRSDRCFITDEAELQAMMREADEYYKQEIESLRDARLRVAQAKRRRPAYIPKTTKSRITDLNTTFYNMKSPADKHTESKGKGKNAEDGATKAKSRAEQRAELREKIESKACVDCKAVCVEVPAAGTSGSRKHVILKDEDIDLWVDLAVQARATTTNPPPALLLNLSDKASRSQKQKEAGPSNPHTPPNIAGRHSPDHHPTFSTYPNPHHYPFGSPAQHALPPYSGFPYGMAPLAPPFAGPGFSFPYPPAYPSFYPPMPTSSNPYAATPSVTNSPWLADWLPSLDVGERGRHGDNFGALVPGFAAARIFRVSQLRNHTEEELQRITFYTKTGSEYHLTPPTTARLMEFVHADAPLVDPPY